MLVLMLLSVFNSRLQCFNGKNGALNSGIGLWRCDALKDCSYNSVPLRNVFIFIANLISGSEYEIYIEKYQAYVCLFLSLTTLSQLHRL
jgi:hypothetical protein